MKILHTADIHLKEVDDERWNVLSHLVEMAHKEEVELFIVSGDLFDKEIDADRLRPGIREIFSNNPFKIILLPGNHDHTAFGSGGYFGSDTVLLNDVNTPFEYKDVCIWGLPFEPIRGQEILLKLRRIIPGLKNTKKNILLYHGELLDAFFSRRDFGDEGEDRYMPLKLSYFRDLSFDYVLAGHFHTHFDVRTLEHGGYFVYPGSPVSVSKRELGRRKVNLFEVGQAPSEKQLDTPYYEQVDVLLNPFSEKDPVEEVEAHLAGLPSIAKPLLTIRGYFNGKKYSTDESELAGKIKRAAQGRAVEINYEFRDISTILEDELFIQFLARLDQGNYSASKKEKLYTIAVEAMMGAAIGKGSPKQS